MCWKYIFLSLTDMLPCDIDTAHRFLLHSLLCQIEMYKKSSHFRDWFLFCKYTMYSLSVSLLHIDLRPQSAAKPLLPNGCPTPLPPNPLPNPPQTIGCKPFHLPCPFWLLSDNCKFPSDILRHLWYMLSAPPEISEPFQNLQTRLPCAAIHIDLPLQPLSKKIPQFFHYK